jgi:hypothetical protein
MKNPITFIFKAKQVQKRKGSSLEWLDPEDEVIIIFEITVNICPQEQHNISENFNRHLISY